MAKAYPSSLAVLREVSLLITEFQPEFDRIRDALNER